MLRRIILPNLLLLAIPLTSGADTPKAAAGLSAAQIVDKDVAAKGGARGLACGPDINLLRQNGCWGKAGHTAPVCIADETPSYDAG